MTSLSIANPLYECNWFAKFLNKILIIILMIVLPFDNQNNRTAKVAFI